MEGFMDVIRASSIGIRNTVALMGTALTKEQISLIKRLSNNIILCLDGDDPGQHAMLNIGNMLLEQGIETKVIVLPNPEDPDSYILKNGKERFQGLIDSAINFSDYKMQKLRENVDFRSDEEKAEYINKMLTEVLTISASCGKIFSKQNPKKYKQILLQCHSKKNQNNRYCLCSSKTLHTD